MPTAQPDKPPTILVQAAIQGKRMNGKVTAFLDAKYKETPIPSVDQGSYYAKHLNIERQKVMTWFSRKRKREKNSVVKAAPDAVAAPLPIPCQAPATSPHVPAQVSSEAQTYINPTALRDTDMDY
ncbi:hypothetical protein CYMTET_22378 [Cymbomonas tetramitiformis]|uniref:Homeobox domain-containing protein n=1 Tax=Cymbomonas tetramitiformis TaxID=36881 RepID=A0AAE0G099_9CHLO|nr:hypothetical protein CYMTET_22378 [Cymbomonas tetramitiformis]